MKNKFKMILIVALLPIVLASCGGASSNISSSNIDSESISTIEEEKSFINDYSSKAHDYLEYIGTNLKNRDIVLPGDTPSSDNRHAETVQWIVSELKNAGYKDQDINYSTQGVSTSSYGNITIQNIVLSVAGKDTNKQVIVGAHYDGDGTGDNGSGVALLLANAVGLYGTEPLYSLQYVFFDAEEIGLYGSSAYSQAMSDSDIAKTQYMINIDAIAFGDYCNLYGGKQANNGTISKLETYSLATAKARYLGLKTYESEDLDGYFAKNKKGPEIERYAFYTNPWTKANPAPKNSRCYSPTTLDASDHVGFMNNGISYVYFEATNWYAKGNDPSISYTGYFDTGNTSIGDGGMFMNTKYDTLENLNLYFPTRAMEHFKIYSPLLSSLLLNPASESSI